MPEIKDFFSELYKERESSDEAADFFFSNSNIPKLDEDAKQIREGVFLVGEDYMPLYQCPITKLLATMDYLLSSINASGPYLETKWWRFRYAFENGHL